jgi:hypothetical protein
MLDLEKSTEQDGDDEPRRLCAAGAMTTATTATTPTRDYSI